MGGRPRNCFKRGEVARNLFEHEIAELKPKRVLARVGGVGCVMNSNGDDGKSKR